MRDDRTVLVVDDDAAIVAMMRDFLEAEGFRVAGAVNAGEALAALDRTAIDCVLLDIMMPGESGFGLCRRVRRTSDVPILFLSARGEDLDKIRGLGLGGDDYIVKSATPPEVVARVKAVLRRTGGKEPARNAVLDFARSDRRDGDDRCRHGVIGARRCGICPHRAGTVSSRHRFPERHARPPNKEGDCHAGTLQLQRALRPLPPARAVRPRTRRCRP